MIELGDRVRDVVSRFTGIVMARTEWLNGCVTFGVGSTEISKEGVPHDKTWFDREQLEVVEKLVVQISGVTDPSEIGVPHGGPDRGEPQTSRG